MKLLDASLIIALVIFGSVAASVPQRAPENRTEPEAIYKYDTEKVRLEGVLIERTFYGPPGFGETPAKDFKDKVLVLKMGKPITVEPVDGAEAKNSPNLDTVRHISQVQLFLPRPQLAEARKLLGKAVVAVGILSEALAPRQYTHVTLDVTTLTAK